MRAPYSELYCHLCVLFKNISHVFQDQIQPGPEYIFETWNLNRFTKANILTVIKIVYFQYVSGLYR